MDALIQDLPFDPAALYRLSPGLITSHHQNNYGGAVKRLNAIRTQLATTAFSTAPGFQLNGLKREELIATNLALALYGTTTTITPGTVTGELLPNPVTPGSLYPLAMQNVSAVQIQDSDATPQTLPVSQYSVNAKHGSLVVLDATSGGPYTEPFTVDYAYGAAQSTAMFTQPLPERWIRFEGLNTADGNREVVIDLYRVAINPAKELSIITDELLKFELSGQVLADLTKPVGGDLGQFGRLVLL